jgi:hypothetical protein
MTGKRSCPNVGTQTRVGPDSKSPIWPIGKRATFLTRRPLFLAIIDKQVLVTR